MNNPNHLLEILNQYAIALANLESAEREYEKIMANVYAQFPKLAEIEAEKKAISLVKNHLDKAVRTQAIDEYTENGAVNSPYPNAPIAISLKQGKIVTNESELLKALIELGNLSALSVNYDALPNIPEAQSVLNNLLATKTVAWEVVISPTLPIKALTQIGQTLRSTPTEPENEAD